MYEETLKIQEVRESCGSGIPKVTVSYPKSIVTIALFSAV